MKVDYEKVSLVGNPVYARQLRDEQYPQSPQLTADEKNILSCEDVKKEIIKQESVISEINRTGNFDGKTVLGFLGDFGIGNGIAKSDAQEKAEKRMEALKEQRNQKCKE
jgi:hypothetical protein